VNEPPRREPESPPASRWSALPRLEAAGDWSWRVVAICAVVLLLVALTSVLRLVVVPLIMGVFVAAVVMPISEKLKEKGARPGLGAFACVLVSLIFIGLVGWMTISALVEPWPTISTDLTKGLDQVRASIAAHGGAQAGTSADSVRSDSGSIVRVMLTGILSFFSVAASVVSMLLLTLFVTFFYVKDGRSIWAAVVSNTGERAAEVDLVGRAIWKKLRAFLRGTAAVAVVDAIGISLGALVLGVPSAGAIFALTFVMAFIPYFGAVMAGAVAVLLAVSEGGISLGLWMLLIVLLVQQVEGTLLQPFLVGRAVALHPMLVALGVIAGGAVAGVVGMFIAVPVMSAVAVAIEVLRGLDDEKSGALEPAALDPATPPSPAA